MLFRSQVLSLREREFVEAARSFGAGTGHLVFKQLLPNLWPQIIVFVSLSLPGYVALEATLSFLGVAHGKMISYPSTLLLLGGTLHSPKPDQSLHAHQPHPSVCKLFVRPFNRLLDLFLNIIFMYIALLNVSVGC